MDVKFLHATVLTQNGRRELIEDATRIALLDQWESTGALPGVDS